MNAIEKSPFIGSLSSGLLVPLSISLGYFCMLTINGSIAGGIFNPAISLIVTAAAPLCSSEIKISYDSFWIYISAPLLSAIIAALFSVYNRNLADTVDWFATFETQSDRRPQLN